MTKRRGRGSKRVVRLPDSYLDVETGERTPAPGARGQGPWYVLLLTPDDERLYLAMTKDVASRAYALERGERHQKVVLIERYLCRHTAHARLMRMRRWPVAERRKLVDTANPSWRDLYEDPFAGVAV